MPIPLIHTGQKCHKTLYLSSLCQEIFFGIFPFFFYKNCWYSCIFYDSSLHKCNMFLAPVSLHCTFPFSRSHVPDESSYRCPYQAHPILPVRVIIIWHFGQKHVCVILLCRRDSITQTWYYISHIFSKFLPQKQMCSLQNAEISFYLFYFQSF